MLQYNYSKMFCLIFNNVFQIPYIHFLTWRYSTQKCILLTLCLLYYLRIMSWEYTTQYFCVLFSMLFSDYLTFLNLVHGPYKIVSKGSTTSSPAIYSSVPIGFGSQLYMNPAIYVSSHTKFQYCVIIYCT